MNQVKFLGLAHAFATVSPSNIVAKSLKKSYGYSSEDKINLLSL